MSNSGQTDKGKYQTSSELVAALASETGGQLRMVESNIGVVRHVGENDVVVLYEVGDDLIEQRYTKDQFLDSKLPELGDRLGAYTYVMQLPPEPEDDLDTTSEAAIEHRRKRRNILRGEEILPDKPSRRRNIRKGPREF